MFGLQPGWIEASRAAVDRRHARIPFRCLMRADQVDADVARALVARAAGWCGWARSRARSGSSTRWRRACASSRFASGAPAARPRASRSACSCSSAIPAKTWDDIEATLELVRAIEPDDIGVSVSYPLPGTRFYERVRARTRREAELVRLRRPRDDVSRDLRAGVLPRAASTSCTTSSAPGACRAICDRWRAGRVRFRAKDLRRLAAWIYNRAALPLAERRLRALAHQTRHAPAPQRLEPVLTQTAAAVPTRQDFSASSLEQPRRPDARPSTRRPLQPARGVLHHAAGAGGAGLGARSLAGRRGHHRRPARSTIRCGASLDATDGALCLGVTRADRRADPRRARGVAGREGAPGRTCPSSGAAGIRRCSPPSASSEPSVDVVVIGQGEDTFARSSSVCRR